MSPWGESQASVFMRAAHWVGWVQKMWVRLPALPQTLL